jgi:hypothetical protein
MVISILLKMNQKPQQKNKIKNQLLKKLKSIEKVIPLKKESNSNKRGGLKRPRKLNNNDDHE